MTRRARQPWCPHVALLVLVLLAAALRFYRLDAQSFWNDEGNSARIAERPLALILEGAAGDIHPPGYYLLLHVWRAVAGQSEFALRSLSAMAGVALVALAYRLGRELFGSTIGLQAAWLGALAPLAVYYSQEARMYALLGVLSVASTLLALRALGAAGGAQMRVPRTPRPGALLAYVALCAAGLYTQYAFAFVLLVHNAVFGLWWLALARRQPGPWRWLGAWVAAQCVIVLLYLPWLPSALGSLAGWSAAGRGYALGSGLLDVLRVFSVGITLSLERAVLPLALFGLLLVAGLWPRRRGQAEWFSVAVCALYFLLPVGLIFAFDLYKPAWLKFLLVVLPAFHLLVARGGDILARAAGRVGRGLQCPVTIALGLAMGALMLPSLRNLYANPAYARDNYRQIASDVATSAPPGACIVLDAPNQWEVFTYYYPEEEVHPAPYQPEPEEVVAFLDPLLTGCPQLFVLYWGDAEADPQRLVETYLALHAYPAGDRWYGNVRLATYGLGALPGEPSEALDVGFGEAIVLRGVAVEEPQGSGGIMPVTLFWRAQAPIRVRYKVTVQVLDQAGQVAAQHDGEPGGGLAPTTVWRVGQVEVDRHGVALPADLATGSYTLIVGLYDGVTGERLRVSTPRQMVGDHVEIAAFSLTNP